MAETAGMDMTDAGVAALISRSQITLAKAFEARLHAQEAQARAEQAVQRAMRGIRRAQELALDFTLRTAPPLQSQRERWSFFSRRSRAFIGY